MRKHNDSHGHDNPTPIPDSGRLYETRDVAINQIPIWFAFLFIFVGGAAFVTYVLFRGFYVRGGEEKSQFPLTYSRQLPPGPRLQANAVQDIKHFRENEAAAVNSYGRDPRTGAIHIPIDRAMMLALPELPIRPGAGTVDIRATTQPNVAPVMDGKETGTTVPPASGTMGAADAGSAAGQPGMAPERTSAPTATPPGTSATAPTNSNSTNSGGGAPTPPPATGSMGTP